MLRLFQQRETLVRYLLGALLVVICIGMTMYLIPGFLANQGSANGQVIATVSGHNISVLAFSQALQQQQQQMQGQIPAAMMPMFGREVLNSLIQREVVLEQAKRLGLTVSNAELAHYLRQNTSLFPNGKFIGNQQYRELIAENFNQSVPEFEDQQRALILEGKLYDLVTDDVRVSPAEVRREFEQEYEKAKIEYVALTPQSLEKQVKATPAELAAYYHTHAAKYMTPERRQLEFVVADPGQFAARVKVTAGEIARYYQQNLGQYTFPERAKVAHILIKTTGLNAAQKQQARQKAEKILAELRKTPGDFARLAKKNSEDPGSAAQGGKLGWITPGQTVAPFQKAAFTLPIGQISGLVKTIYGYHIIKVEARQSAHTETLAQATPQIATRLQQAESRTAAQNAIEQAAELAPAMGLAGAAKKLKLPLITTPPVSRTDPVEYVGVSPEFVNAVFQTPVNGLTPALHLPSGYVLAKVKAIIPPAQPPFGQVATQVKRNYARYAAQQQEQKQALALAAAAKKQGLKGLQSAATRLQLKTETSGWLGRDDTLHGVGAVSMFFPSLLSLKPGQAAGPVTVGSDQLVYILQQVQPPPPGTFAHNRSQIENTLLNQKRQRLFTAYGDALLAQTQKAGKVRINRSQLSNLLQSNGGM